MSFKSVLIFTSILSILLISCSKQAEEPLPDLSGKRVVMIIAHRDFRDEELFEPRSILEGQGAEVLVASSSLQIAKGMKGGTVKPDLLIDDVDVSEFDAVIFVGGVGASEYWENPKAHEIARKAVELGKVVAAICIAPVTLANAGVLEGRRATVWPSESGRIVEKGAIYTGADVEVDGNIITANGPSAAKEFAKAIARKLSSQ